MRHYLQRNQKATGMSLPAKAAAISSKDLSFCVCDSSMIESNFPSDALGEVILMRAVAEVDGAADDLH